MNVLIIEDESHTANLLNEIIESDRSFLVVKTTDSIEDSVQYLGKYQSNIDLIFMDIQLIDGYSFEIFKHVDIIVPVIFCTAYDEFALQAIQNNGMDYILKPFADDLILNALKKYQKLIGNIQNKSPYQFQINNTSSKQIQKSFLVQIREKTLIVPTEQIALFSLTLETVYIYTFSSEKYPIYKNLDYVENVMSNDNYFRINRQMIVHRNAISTIEPYFNRKVIVRLDINLSEEIIVSRLKVTAFKQWLEMSL